MSSELELSNEGQDMLNIIRELRVLDELGIKTITQLLTHRLNDELITTMVIGKEEQIALSLYKVIISTHSPGILGYGLRFMADLCLMCGSLAKALAVSNAEAVFGSDPAATFMQLATTHARDGGISNPAVFLSASCLRHSADGIRGKTVERFLAHVTSVFGATTMTVDDVEYTVHAVSVFVRRRELRSAFQEAKLVQHIPRILVEACDSGARGVDGAAVVQLTYETLLTAWILSYDHACIVDLHRNKIIPTVHRVLQRVSKEKCIRMAIAILNNLCHAQKKYYAASEGQEWVEGTIYVLGEVNSGKGPNFYADMIGIGLMKTLWQLARRKFGDDDILTTIEELTTLLERNLDSMSSFSEYRGEIESGVLEWSPVHTSTKFWKENITKFEENHFEVLKELGELITHSKNELTLAVACHDVGEAVRHHPSGRLMLQVPQLAGVKEKIMGLMSHQNPEVAKHALLAVQKIMVQRWEFIK